jgi:hypothetical protein
MPKTPAAPNKTATNFNDMCEAASLIAFYTNSNVYIMKGDRGCSEMVVGSNSGFLMGIRFI